MNRDAEWLALGPPLTPEEIVRRLRELIRYPCQSREAHQAKFTAMALLGFHMWRAPHGSVAQAWEAAVKQQRP